MEFESRLEYRVTNQSPKWGFVDLFMWKVIPDRLGGGRRYIQRFKSAWVIHNKLSIRSAAERYKLPVELLAGVCWIEVGGDPNIVDRIAFEVRALDWIGPGLIDRNFTVTNPPEKTSFGFVSIQLRTAAKTLGIDVKQLNSQQLRHLAKCIEQDIYNINLVAKHLRQLADYDHLPIKLSIDDARIIGSRYNRGVEPTLEDIKRNSRYGDFIINHWKLFTLLVWV